LLELTECHLFLSASGVSVADILAARQMKHATCPDLDALLDPSVVAPYPFHRSLSDAANDVFLILHSSGTTGLPKPIRVTHGQIAANDYMVRLPEESNCGGPGFVRIDSAKECTGRLIVPFAPFHIISIMVLLCFTVFGKSTYIFGPEDRGMTANDLLDAIEHGKGDCTFCSPGLLEKYASSEADLEKLGKLSKIAYGGGMTAFRSYSH
jgi:acyl-CoA synthetase (AMP-forming)/AMP-acid ligase II